MQHNENLALEYWNSCRRTESDPLEIFVHWIEVGSYTMEQYRTGMLLAIQSHSFATEKRETVNFQSVWVACLTFPECFDFDFDLSLLWLTICIPALPFPSLWFARPCNPCLLRAAFYPQITYFPPGPEIALGFVTFCPIISLVTYFHFLSCCSLNPASYFSLNCAPKSNSARFCLIFLPPWQNISARADTQICCDFCCQNQLGLPAGPELSNIICPHFICCRANLVSANIFVCWCVSKENIWNAYLSTLSRTIASKISEYKRRTENEY